MDSIKSQLIARGFDEASISRAFESCPDAQTLEHIMSRLKTYKVELDAGESTSNCASTSAQVTTRVDVVILTGKDDEFRREPAADPAVSKVRIKGPQKPSARRMELAIERIKKFDLQRKMYRENKDKLMRTWPELDEQERERLLENTKRDKLKQKAHRQRILEQIALDRLDMKTKHFLAETGESSTSSFANTSNDDDFPMATSNECTIALRFPDGTTKFQKFSPQEQLAAVRLFVQMVKTNGRLAKVEFIVPPNRKLDEAQMQQTLESLDLCPASRLEVLLEPFSPADQHLSKVLGRNLEWMFWTPS